MKILLVLLILLMFGRTYADYSFTKVRSEKFEDPLKRGYFFNMECKGDTCISFNSYNGGLTKILRSEDAGLNWEISYLEDEIQFENKLLSINFGNYYSDDLLLISLEGTVKVSNDGGYNFVDYNTPSEKNLRNSRILDINNVYVSENNTIFHSDNAGQTWDTLHTFWGNMINDFYIFSKDTIGCLAYNIELNKKLWHLSTDSGNNWEISNIMEASSVYFYDNKGWATGGIANGIGTQKIDIIQYTDDYGKTWVLQRNELSVPSFGLSSINFRNDQEGMAVGPAGNIQFTENGGKDWVQIVIDEFKNAEVPPLNLVIAWAGDIPIIGASNFGIYVGQRIKSVSSQNDLSIELVFPNPTTNSARVRFYSNDRNPENISVAIYDVLGNQFKNFTFELEMSSPYSYLTLNTGELSAGSYFVHIKNETDAKVQLFIKK